MIINRDNKKVLLIDDDLSIRFVLRKIVNRLFKDVEVFTSSDAVEGLGYIFLLKSEVVIIDTTLPSYGGLEVLDYISSNKKLKEINPKVIVLYDDPKYINTKLGYTFIHKGDYHFLDKLIDALGEKLQFNNYLENSNFFNLLKALGSEIIRYADKTNLNFFEILHSKNIFTKLFSSIGWLVNQIMASFYLVFFYMIGGRKVKELNIEQNKVDLKKFRFKTYPTIAMSVAGILLLLFQVGVFAGGFLTFKTVVQAASYTWDGGGTDGTCGGGAGDGNKWSCAANWSSDIVPTGADTVTFNSTSTKDAVVDSGFAGTTGDMTITTGYTGTITLQRSLTTGRITQSTGTLNAGSQSLIIGIDLTLSGGVFIASSGTTTIARAIAISGSPTFNHNNGTVALTHASGNTYSISCNSVTFNLVTINTNGVMTINSNCSLPLGNNPTILSDGNITLNGTLSGTGTLTRSSTFSPITMNSGALLSGFSGLNSPLTVSGASVDLSAYTTFISNASSVVTLSSGSLSLPSGADINGGLTISGGTFTAPSGTMTVAGALTISGTPTFNANTGTITFDGAGVILSCNNVTFNLVTFNNTGTKTVSTNCSLPLGASPTLAGTGSITLNGTLSGSGTLTKTSGTLTLNNVASTLSGFSGLNVFGFSHIAPNSNFSSYSPFVVNDTFTMAGGTLTLPSIVDANNQLNISAGTFNAPSGTMTFAGALTVTGSPTFNANGGTFTFDGTGTHSCGNITFNLVTFNNSGSETFLTDCTIPLGNNPVLAGSGTVAIAGGTFSGTGRFTKTASTFSISTATSQLNGFTEFVVNASSISSSGILNLTGYTLVTFNSTLSLTSGTVTLPNGADFNGSVTISGGTFNASSGNIFIAGFLTISGSPTFSANGGTITFDGGAATLSCNNVTFNLVSFTGQTGIKTVNSNCSLPLGTNPSIPNGITLSGTLSGTGTMSTLAGTLTMNSGSLLSGFSSLILNGPGGMIMNGGSFTGLTAISVVGTGAFTINGAAVNLTNFTTADFQGSFVLTTGSFIAPTASMNVGRTFTISSGTTFNANGGTIVFNGNAAASLSCNNVAFNLVAFQHTANTKTVNSNCSLPLGNNPTVGVSGTAGITLNGGTLSGSGTLTTATGTFTYQNGAVLSGFSGFTFNGQFTQAATTANTTLNLGSSTPVNFNNSFVMNTPTNPFTNTFTAPSGTMNVNANFTLNTGTTFNANGGTINMNGTTFGIISCNNTAFNLVTLTHTVNARTVSSNCNLPLGNNPTITGGISNMFGTLSGTGTLTSLAFFRINGGGQITGFNSMHNSTLEISGATVNLTNLNSVTVDGTFQTFGSSIFFSPTNMTVGGNFLELSTSTALTAPSGILTVAGNFSISGGAFNHNNGTIVLNGTNQTIIGTTFNNLTKTVTSADTLTITAGNTETVVGTLTLKGTSGNLLSLVSSTPGTQWNIDPQGTRDIEYLNVTDSNNINASAIQTLGLNITNGGNNTNWNFNYPVVILNNFNDGSVTTDKTPTFNFNITDPDAANTVKYQIQIDNNSDFSSPEVDSTSSLSAQGDFSFTPSSDLADGSYYLRIKATDSTNGTTGFTVANDDNVAFKVDTTGPTGTIYIGFGTNTGNDHDVYLIFKATDNVSGVKEMIYSENPNFEGTSYINYQTAKIFTLSEGYGRKIVYVKYKDFVGNESLVYSSGVTLENQTVDSDTENPNNVTPEIPGETETPTQENLIAEIAILMLDADNNPLKNVTLFLNGVEAITDEFGVAIFKNVPKGDNKITGTVSGLSFEQTINVDANTKVYKVIIEQSNNNVLIYLMCGTIVILLVLVIIFIIKLRNKNKHKK